MHLILKIYSQEENLSHINIFFVFPLLSYENLNPIQDITLNFEFIHNSIW